MWTKFPIFWSNPLTNPFGKIPILWVFCFRCSERLVWYIKRQKSFFHDLFSRSMTWEYRGLHGVSRGYRWLQGVTMGDKGLQGVTRGDNWWQGVRKDYKIFFLFRTFPYTFFWSILHKNQSSRNLKFLRKTIDINLWKISNFAFLINTCFYSL